MSSPPKDLFQKWLHSHEEDTAIEQVYRPSGFAFPPSRGRRGFEIEADGSCTCIGIAARDGSTRVRGTWEFEEDGERRLTLKAPSGSQVLWIVSLDPDRLVVRK